MVFELIRELPYQIWWLVTSSLIFLLIILAMVPVIILKLPVDYFSQKKNVGIIRNIIFPFNYILLSLKNLLGLILLIFGLLLLFLPGQGLLTIFTGLIIMNFPGKRRFELYFIRKKSVLKTINWVRHKAGKELIINIYSKHNDVR
jgi:hypothetical protein